MSEVHISEIEWFVINKVKEMRNKHGISQFDLADKLGLSHGFVGQVESQKYRAKYNLSHINTLAKIFECSPQDFLPREPF